MYLTQGWKSIGTTRAMGAVQGGQRSTINIGWMDFGKVTRLVTARSIPIVLKTRSAKRFV